MNADRLESMLENGVGFDTETWLIKPGLMAPRMVCWSASWFDKDANQVVGQIGPREEGSAAFERILDDESIVVAGANVSYDIVVMLVHMAREGKDVFPQVRKMLEDGRVFDIQLAEQLHAIAEGHLGKDPRTMKDIINPETKKPGRYSLSACVDMVLGRTDAKANDEWRLKYAELDGIPIKDWPQAAVDYPIDDARNTLECALAQAGHRPRLVMQHVWKQQPDGSNACSQCGKTTFGGPCMAIRANSNLHDLAHQQRANTSLALAGAYGFRVDQAKADVIERHAIENRDTGAAPFIEAGIIRKDGTENQAELKRRVAVAYGAKSPCPTCSGTGKVPSPSAKPVKCRKCAGLGLNCDECAGVGKRVYTMINCCVVPDAANPKVKLKTCDGTGLMLTDDVPRTDGNGVGAGRDPLYESGDNTLMAYAEYCEDDKVLATMVPYLRNARVCVACGQSGAGKTPHTCSEMTPAYRDVPLTLSYNSLVESGRVSCTGAIQLFPRKSGYIATEGKYKGEYVPSLREAIVARPSMVFSSEDFHVGELFAHAQSCIWLLGFSDLGASLLDGRDPHSELASSIMNLDYKEFTRLLKEVKDPTAKGMRQGTKCFHPETQILTKRGWVRVDQLSYEDDVAAATPGATGVAIEWQRPTALTSRPSDGTLVHLKNLGMDLRVTDDHRMLVRGGSGKWKVVTPREVEQQRGWYNAGTLETSGSWHPDERIMRLAIATQADGYINPEKEITFGFVKDRKIERLRTLLMPGEYSEYTYTAQTSTGQVTSFKLHRDISDTICELLDDRKQFTWQWLELSTALLDLVMDEVRYWDSFQHTNGRHFQFHSTQHQSVEVIQAIATLSGCKTRLVCLGRQKEHHNDVWKLTVRDKPDTRGDNLDTVDVPYTGDVYCLSVPASFVVARDGGVPVVVGQCFNFGKPTGMGDVKVCLTARRQGEDTPCPCGPMWIVVDGKRVRGYKGTRFCIIVDGAPSCGEVKVNRWGPKGREQEIPPTCAHCLEVAMRLGKAWKFKNRENVAYGKLCTEFKDSGMPITEEMLNRWPHLQQFFTAGMQTKPGQIMQHVTGRLRTCDGYSELANSFFQGLIGDITKEAFWRVTVECLDRTVRVPDFAYENSRKSKFGGGPSPLYGSHAIGFFHDECFMEHPESVAPEAAVRVAEIMEETACWYMPDVAKKVKAEPTLMKTWDKRASYVTDANGRLAIWEPPAAKAVV